MTTDIEALIAEARSLWSGSAPEALSIVARTLADALESVAAERDDLETRLAELLCELTDGRMSKTGYDVPTMVREVEATFERAAQAEIQEAVAERDEWKAAAKRATERWAGRIGRGIVAVQSGEPEHVIIGMLRGELTYLGNDAVVEAKYDPASGEDRCVNHTAPTEAAARAWPKYQDDVRRILSRTTTEKGTEA